MATQRCPKCKSNRVRLGYRHTPLLLKAVFRYNLLCDNCNWEFTGFAIPGTVPRRTKKNRNTVETNNLAVEDNSVSNEIDSMDSEGIFSNFENNDSTVRQPLAVREINKNDENFEINQKKRIKKKVRVKLN